jgi:hypothetical protein
MQNSPRPQRRSRLTFESLEPRNLLAGSPWINELMAINNHSLQDRDGEYSDWIELHNAEDTPLGLGGWYLTDDSERLNRWRLPAVSIPPHGYLVVFASGNDRVDPQSELHTNFRLSGDGEFLALVEPNGTTIHQQFTPAYPRQRADVSYGLSDDLLLMRYFATPTPGAANGSGAEGIVSDVLVSVQRGFFDEPVDVTLTTDTAGAQVRYTLDGSPPTAETGMIYSGPVRVVATTTLRAAAFKSGYLASEVSTHSYLFVRDVLTQDQPAGYPDLPAGDYAVIPQAVEFHRDTILNDLKAVPSMSLVLPTADMFGSTGTNTTGDDHGTSVELIFPDGRPGFQINAGLRQQGGASRLPDVPKHAFRLRFDAEFGPTRLEFPLFPGSSVATFDTVILRANLQDGWQRGPANNNQYIKDEFARKTQLAMGQPSAHGTWVHVYFNGLYWGLYNLTERPDASFASAHLGGESQDWDSLNAGALRDGNLDAWNQMVALTPRGAPDLPNFTGARVQANYEAIQTLLDVPGFIDYILIGTYVATQDWLPNNYYAGRRSRNGGEPSDTNDPASKFRFFHWDQEESMLGPDSTKNLPGFSSPVGRIFQLLRLSSEFRELHAQRLYDRLFHGGPLSPEVAAARYQSLIREVEDAIKGEAIRWGQAPSNVPDWRTEAESLLAAFFPGRRERIIDQYRRLDLYPDTDAPVLSQQGGVVHPTDMLTITATRGDIYFTTDGSDPKLPDGTVSPSAARYTAAITLSANTTLQTRALAHGEWSVLNRAVFTVDQAPLPGDFDRGGTLNLADIDLLCQQVRSVSPNPTFDLTGDGRVTRADHEHWVDQLMRTSFGDANLDRVFDSSDLVVVFQAGQYEDTLISDSTWATGDWDCDGEFGTADLVLAFQKGGYAGT